MATQTGRRLAITWYGHATFVITTPGGKKIVTDPWLEGNPMCPPDMKRITEADVILLSHGHSDHTGRYRRPSRARRAHPSSPCTSWRSGWSARGWRTSRDGHRRDGVHRGPPDFDGAGRPHEQRRRERRHRLSRSGRRVRRSHGERSGLLFRRRYGALQRHAAHRRALQARYRVPAHRRSFHDGSGRRGAGRADDRRRGRSCRCTSARSRC